MSSIYDVKFGTNNSYETEGKDRLQAKANEIDDIYDLSQLIKTITKDYEFCELYEIMQAKFGISLQFEQLDQEQQLLFMIKFYIFSQSKLDLEKGEVKSLLKEKADLEKTIENIKVEKFKKQQIDNGHKELEKEAMKIEINSLKESLEKIKLENQEIKIKLENRKEKKKKLEELADKSATLINSNQILENENKEIKEKLNKISNEVTSKTSLLQKQKNEIENLKNEVNNLIKENKLLNEQKNKLEVLYARYASRNPLNEEEKLSGVILNEQFDVLENMATEKNEIKVTGKIKLNKVNQKPSGYQMNNNNNNLLVNNPKKQKEIEIMDTNKYPIKISEAPQNMNSNFESVLTVDGDEVESQKSEDEENYVNNNQNNNIDYESYNSLMFETKNFDTKTTNPKGDDFGSLNYNSSASSVYQTKKNELNSNLNTNLKNDIDFDHGTIVNTETYETNEISDPKY